MNPGETVRIAAQDGGSHDEQQTTVDDDSRLTFRGLAPGKYNALFEDGTLKEFEVEGNVEVVVLDVDSLSDSEVPAAMPAGGGHEAAVQTPPSSPSETIPTQGLVPDESHILQPGPPPPPVSVDAQGFPPAQRPSEAPHEPGDHPAAPEAAPAAPSVPPASSDHVGPSESKPGVPPADPAAPVPPAGHDEAHLESAVEPAHSEPAVGESASAKTPPADHSW